MAITILAPTEASSLLPADIVSPEIIGQAEWPLITEIAEAPIAIALRWALSIIETSAPSAQEIIVGAIVRGHPAATQEPALLAAITEIPIITLPETAEITEPQIPEIQAIEAHIIPALTPATEIAVALTIPEATTGLAAQAALAVAVAADSEEAVAPVVTDKYLHSDCLGNDTSRGNLFCSHGLYLAQIQASSKNQNRKKVMFRMNKAEQKKL